MSTGIGALRAFQPSAATRRQKRRGGSSSPTLFCLRTAARPRSSRVPARASRCSLRGPRWGLHFRTAVERLSRNPPAWILLAVLAMTVVGTLAATAGMTFYQDTWAFLIDRQDLSANSLFYPHNEHLVVFPVLIEMALIRVFGMSNATPEYVLLAIFLVVTALLLYIYMQRRVGPWLALFGAVIVLTLGPAWEVLLWPFEITFIGPILFGLAMLLALERGDRPGDVAACVF